MSDAKAEAEVLLNALLPFGQKMLLKHQDFMPYGGVLDSTGKVLAISVVGERELIEPVEVISRYNQHFKERAGNEGWRATGVFYDSLVVVPTNSHQTDAIAANLNHVSGYSVIVYFPYEKKETGVEFGEVFAKQQKNEIFRMGH